MFLRISHLTRYDYSQPVSFAPHALYLRPRETPRQRLHNFELSISPDARRVPTNDPLDNALDWAYFAPDAMSDQLEFKTEFLVETLDTNPFDFFLKPSACSFPFTYDTSERHALTSCLTPRSDTAPGDLLGWFNAQLPDRPSETVAFFSALNSAVFRSLRYNRRNEEGIQSAAQTLVLGTGSCRDYAVFLIEVCRSIGIAARFVSGYLYEAPPPGVTNPLMPAMHAWAEIYLPGAGWRGLDATRGIFCDDAFVPLAHAAVAESVSPVQGTFISGANVSSSLTTHLVIDKL